ncbi:uncharacterized [Tachysurus ichikawai]
MEHVKTRRRTEQPCAASEPNGRHSSTEARLAQRRERAKASESIGVSEKKGWCSHLSEFVFCLLSQTTSPLIHHSRTFMGLIPSSAYLSSGPTFLTA